MDPGPERGLTCSGPVQMQWIRVDPDPDPKRCFILIYRYKSYLDYKGLLWTGLWVMRPVLNKDLAKRRVTAFLRLCYINQNMLGGGGRAKIFARA